MKNYVYTVVVFLYYCIMIIKIKKRKQKNLIYLCDEVNNPIQADIVSKDDTEKHVLDLLTNNPKVNRIETINMLHCDLF